MKSFTLPVERPIGILDSAERDDLSIRKYLHGLVEIAAKNTRPCRYPTEPQRQRFECVNLAPAIARAGRNVSDENIYLSPWAGQYRGGKQLRPWHAGRPAGG